uniref:AMP-binding domain-containing protein n=1 Tax=Rhabditophanes sp. KR3021 TaxID=114890 RepID=A0AC35U0Q3_9BILA
MRIKQGLKTSVMDLLIFNKIKRLFGGQIKMLISGVLIDPDTQRFIQICMGITVQQGYGSTEALIVSMMDKNDLS